VIPGVDPVWALAVFFAGLLVAAACLWPRRGLVPSILRMIRMSERVRMEDALKHLFDTETRGVTATVESLAGVLHSGTGTVIRIVERLEALGLARPIGEGFGLTESGRAYALRILRTHRLVERYLADRTGVQPAEWHAEAERLEHRLDEAATERLARRMGHPRYDPHGDPIPTSAGVMPAPQGMMLSAVTPRRTVSVIHLEDEPPEAFERLLATGLAIGQRLQVLDADPVRIRYRSEGRDSSLAVLLARNVTVVPVADDEAEETTGLTLADVPLGGRAVVIALSSACEGPQRRRLLDLGVVRGTQIRPLMASAAGDPVAYEIRGAAIGLRRQQAEWIRVRLVETAEGAAA
jgi:DtxR family Mn-dependent transcriptional regulator